MKEWIDNNIHIVFLLFVILLFVGAWVLGSRNSNKGMPIPRRIPICDGKHHAICAENSYYQVDCQAERVRCDDE